ncbi:FYVE zinc finger domain-containing protein [Candidatus Bathyarchaeota archaeon]|nr:FYVE zinc finger domain-containing protein [Candidatus Bathyarchaeota archaeon]
MATVHEKTANLTCADCNRTLSSTDEERTWAKCRFCGKPVCFDCIRYMGTAIRGPYMDYVEAMRTCNKCYIRRG